MKTTAQILAMSELALRRLVARQQIEIADHERGWAGSGHPDDWPAYDKQLTTARRVKREVYAATKDPST